MVGFYLLPRKSSQSKPSTEKPTEPNHSPDHSSSSRYSRLPGRRVARTGPRTEKNATSHGQNPRTLSRADPLEIPTQKRRIYKKQRDNNSRTPEVLFESTPLYVPNNSDKKSEDFEKQNNHKQSVEDNDKNLKRGGKYCAKERETAKQDTMLHTRSERDEENEELKTEDNYSNEKLFRSISPGGGDIHNMRIQAGIMINTHTSNRRGHYNNTR